VTTHKRDCFSCEAETLDRYLKIQASQDKRRRFAAPYVAVTSYAVVVDAKDDAAIAFYPHFNFL
jgi:hypothetical protein